MVFLLFLRLLRSSEDEELLELSEEELSDSLSDSEELSLDSELLLAARFDFFFACFLVFFSTEAECLRFFSGLCFRQEFLFSLDSSRSRDAFRLG